MPAFRNIKAESNWNASHTHDGKVAKAKAKAAARRNARLALLVNNWPGSSASGKKARKLQRNLRYTLQRSVEDSGEIEMPDAPETGVQETREETPEEDKMQGIQ